ncbi:MAG TPA: hydrogenase maturation protease [Candidatus Acidoferrales bacterium]|jgi:hydrogenase maturation protease|nr:hydrogenase maturation protease [Candidatus Acidoferrales bacterium]
MTGGAPRVLVAGIGNIFLADDGFGVEVIRRMSVRSLPEGVCLRDFGIRGLDLAYALNDPWDLVILVDALPRGETPGTVFVLEPDREDLEAGLQSGIQIHGMDPVQAIRLAKSLGEIPQRLLVVGCEPADLGGEEGAIGLSPEVENAIETAIEAILKQLKDEPALAPR